MSKEAFVYLWYDAPNDMYYLGKHKGLLDDKYTHSSTIWESFTKDNIPEGVTRRILAYGTDEEMCILEHELLVNRKKRCWNRYYNESLGDPRYVDTSGENNPNWKDGRTVGIRDNPEIRASYDKEYNQKPERKAKLAAWNINPAGKARSRKSSAKYHAKKKAEKQGAGSLDAFLK